MNEFNYYESSGKLNYDQDGNYILDKLNISELLKGVYHNENNNFMGFKLFKDGKLICEEEGILYKDKNSKRIYVYYINGFGIEDLLWECTNKNINLEIWSEGIYGKTIHTDK